MTGTDCQSVRIRDTILRGKLQRDETAVTDGNVERVIKRPDDNGRGRYRDEPMVGWEFD